MVEASKTFSYIINSCTIILTLIISSCVSSENPFCEEEFEKHPSLYKIDSQDTLYLEIQYPNDCPSYLIDTSATSIQYTQNGQNTLKSLHYGYFFQNILTYVYVIYPSDIPKDSLTLLIDIYDETGYKLTILNNE